GEREREREREREKGRERQTQREKGRGRREESKRLLPHWPANLQTKSHLISSRSSVGPLSTLMYQTALSGQQRASRPHMDRSLISATQRGIFLCKVIIRPYS